MARALREEDTASPYLPSSRDLGDLRAAAAGCRGCELYRAATQTVFGEGDPHARMVLVGEQPGDQEDKDGHPFVGPAGRVLSRALDELGVVREDVYVTNAVKHFSFTPKGKRRIHRTPSLHDLVACSPWLEAELEAVRPEVLVCLGATAVRAVLGPGQTVGALRGRLLEGDAGGSVVVTTHPSAVLRATDREAVYAAMRDDLAVAVSALG